MKARLKFMKTRKTGNVVVALMAAFFTLAATRSDAIIVNYLPVGVTLGQTARLNFLNIGMTRAIIVDYRFLDADGNVLAQSNEHLLLPMGRIVSVDLNRDTIPHESNRIQIRIEVTIGDPNLRYLRTSTEVVNN